MALAVGCAPLVHCLFEDLGPRRVGVAACDRGRGLWGGILFVGNSYTFAHDLPGITELLADRWDLEPPLETRTVAFPGVSLAEHWERGTAGQVIGEGGWDFVVLQGHSLKPLTEPQQVAEMIRRFHASIRAQGAKTILYLTWARRGVPAMQEGLNDLMFGMAEELGALVVPVGPAWQRAAVVVPDIGLYDDDGSHPAPAGTYLAACVFIGALYGPEAIGEVKVETPTSDGGWQVLEPEPARALREIAREAVVQGKPPAGD